VPFNHFRDILKWHTGTSRVISDLAITGDEPADGAGFTLEIFLLLPISTTEMCDWKKAHFGIGDPDLKDVFWIEGVRLVIELQPSAVGSVRNRCAYSFDGSQSLWTTLESDLLVSKVIC
jgi:hypothetical protein